MVAKQIETMRDNVSKYTLFKYTFQFETHACRREDRETHQYCIIQHLADGVQLLRAAVVVDEHTLLHNTPARHSRFSHTVGDVKSTVVLLKLCISYEIRGINII